MLNRPLRARLQRRESAAPVAQVFRVGAFLAATGFAETDVLHTARSEEAFFPAPTLACGGRSELSSLSARAQWSRSRPCGRPSCSHISWARFLIRSFLSVSIPVLHRPSGRARTREYDQKLAGQR